jgi:hypothetical protein
MYFYFVCIFHILSILGAFWFWSIFDELRGEAVHSVLARSILFLYSSLSWIGWHGNSSSHYTPLSTSCLGFRFWVKYMRLSWYSRIHVIRKPCDLALPVSSLRVTRTWGRMLSVFEINEGVSMKIWTKLRWHVWFMCNSDWFIVYLSWDGWFIEWLTDLTHLWIWALVVCTLKSSSSSNTMYGGFRVSNWAVLSAAHAIKLH